MGKNRMLQPFPQTVPDETTLNELLSRPTPALVEMMQRLEGDIIILGIAGKMGVTLGMMAARAIQAAGVDKRVIGVSRFSDAATRAYLDTQGIETIRCDILDRDAIAQLPQVKNVIYMVGRKFGTQGSESATWAANVIAPDNVCHHFQKSHIVAFSTGCVYPLVPVTNGGSTESDLLQPVGEYAQSCLGRERVFDYWSRTRNTPICLLRLNYAIDLRYGVLYDIGTKVYAGQSVDLTVSHFNAIWQGDANYQALRCLDHCATPAQPLNITGPETVSVRYVAEQFARIFGMDSRFTDGEENGQMYLNNSAKATALFGYPTVSLLQMIKWQAAWIQAGGKSLNKPTHFAVVDGEF